MLLSNYFPVPLYPSAISDLRGDLRDKPAFPGPLLIHLQLISQIPHLSHWFRPQHSRGPFPEHSREYVPARRRQYAVELVRPVSGVLQNRMVACVSLKLPLVPLILLGVSVLALFTYLTVGRPEQGQLVVDLLLHPAEPVEASELEGAPLLLEAQLQCEAEILALCGVWLEVQRDIVRYDSRSCGSESSSTSQGVFASIATYRVGWLLSGRVGCLVRANYIAFLGEDGEDFDFLAVLLHKPL